jgi:hypothetical protein
MMDVRGSIVLLLIPALFGAEPAKLPEPFRSIADLAAAAPPEFTADALLRMVESGRIADKNARRELVEQAFQLAASAKFGVRMEGLTGTPADTRSGSLSQAYGLKLDVLSLQSRAVRDMLPLDQSKARELFGQMLNPTLAPLTCDDALVYEPSEFYQALTAVVNGAFTPKEKTKDLHFNLLIDSLGQVTSPSQLPALATVIESAGVTAAQRQTLWARFNGLLESMQPDARSFAASLPALSVLTAPGFQPLFEKYRLRGHGCETDSAPSSGKQPSTPKLDLYWQSASARQMLQTGKTLRFAADRTNADWQQQLADYLNLIASWTQDTTESDAVFYHEKCMVYTSLLDLVTSGPLSDRILADFVDFAGSSGLYQQSPVEWWLEPSTLLDRSQNNPGLHSRVLQAFHDSGNPVLALEVALESTFRDGRVFHLS